MTMGIPFNVNLRAKTPSSNSSDLRIIGDVMINAITPTAAALKDV
jgi:hypothetical protein